MKYSKLTSKNQATIPKEIRKTLKLESGDVVTFKVVNNKTVIIQKASPIDLEYLKSLNSTLSEWNSEEDEDAYKNL